MGSLCSSDHPKNISKSIPTLENWMSSSQTTLSDFSIIRLINAGAFGKVMLVLKKDDHQLYAMKVISKRQLQSPTSQAYAFGQMDILSTVKSDFVINLHFAFQNSYNLFLILDFIQGGDLFSHLQYRRRFSYQTAQFCLAEILLGLEDLHKFSIVYRDLKPENILVDFQGHLKLADFNQAVFLDQKQKICTSICGTPEYISPEVILERPHGRKVDFWSLGVLLYEMLTGFSPFQGKSKFETFKKVLQGRFLTPLVQSEALDLINRLLQFNPEDRPSSVKEIKKHRFFKGINWRKLRNRQVCSPLKPIPNKYQPSTPASHPTENSTPRSSLLR